MSGNYSNVKNDLIDISRQDTTAQFSDIENFKNEFFKNSLQGVGGLGVGSQLSTGLKALRAKLSGPTMQKLGFKSEDLDELQTAMDAGDFEKSISILGNKLTSKLTDSGRNLLGSIKDKLENINKPSEPLDSEPIEIEPLNPVESLESEAFQGGQPNLISVANRGLGPSEENPLPQLDTAPQVEKAIGDGSQEAAAASEDLGQAATEAAEQAAKKAALTGVKDELGGALADSSVLDFSPIGWGVTLAAGIGTLIAGAEIKAHSQKFRAPPNMLQSYSSQEDA